MAEPDHNLDRLLAWCAAELGPVEPVADCGKSHPGQPAIAQKLRLDSDYCYLKTHRAPGFWEAEVHGYEQWAAAFGSHAPHLLAVREEEPLALVVSALPGQCLENVHLPPAQEQRVWRDAGRALARLHNLATGEFFGPCNRDGSPRQGACTDAQEFMAVQLEQERERGVRMGYLTPAELAVVQAALEQIPAFAGEPPVPCHRDYCSANWVVSDDGRWVGVIDFEFAEWNVRVADFTRHPNWEWIGRPDLAAAFFAGYGPLTPAQERQCFVAHVHYALTAIIWGEDNHYHGFAAEGRAALRHLATMPAAGR